MLYSIIEVIKPLLSVQISFSYTFKLNASVHPMLVLKTPVAAHIPLFREVAFPVFQKGLSCLMLLMRVDDFDILIDLGFLI
jgi:hypothetical protein